MNPFSLALLVLLALLAFYGSPATSTSRHAFDNYHRPVQNGFRVKLIHVDSGVSLTKFERTQRAIESGKNRMKRLSAPLMADPSADYKFMGHLEPGGNELVLPVYIGNPPVWMQLILDTGSDLIWAQSLPCKHCDLAYDDPLFFDPSNSSTFSNVSCSSELCKSLPYSKCTKGCEYQYDYGDNSTTRGYMGTDTFQFGDDGHLVPIPHIGFGCGLDNQALFLEEADGILGLGRGPLSLISQLGAKTFSYCMADGYTSFSSFFMVGSLPNISRPTISIPMMRNPYVEDVPYYYVSIEGITVGDTLIPLPNSTFEIRKDGTGGMFVDSGTTITFLEKEVFELVKLIFHFKGGADLELDPESYFVEDFPVGAFCLAMMPYEVFSVLGNIQLYNMYVVYDLEKEMLIVSSSGGCGDG
ncbi:PREDICTED: aspartic proteinase nepenthesin-1 [Nelumbo nucifera]|uniref:Aspartic proteinase nepenthesin-1 n=1 Tax=Nelumbo nucifera TaxID=4432 RepID=A0A1U8AXS1_NELNU|nr:PREDICTED: aspartic proteinase nepenthesin-1 [Nelumbo nucifera]